MASEEFKKNIDQAVKIIESCWDENNPNDKLSFDERLEQKIRECEDENIKSILLSSKEGF